MLSRSPPPVIHSGDHPATRQPPLPCRSKHLLLPFLSSRPVSLHSRPSLLSKSRILHLTLQFLHNHSSPSSLLATSFASLPTCFSILTLPLQLLLLCLRIRTLINNNIPHARCDKPNQAKPHPLLDTAKPLDPDSSHPSHHIRRYHVPRPPKSPLRLSPPSLLVPGSILRPNGYNRIPACNPIPSTSTAEGPILVAAFTEPFTCHLLLIFRPTTITIFRALQSLGLRIFGNYF